MEHKTFNPEEHEILRVLVGSQMHGTGEPGHEDTDLMAITIEPAWMVFGTQHFETAQIRTQPEGVRSGPDDTDLVIHSLRKWVALATKGNPSILLPLYVPQDHEGMIRNTFEGARLRGEAHLFVTKRAGAQHLGYMQAQRARLTGERGGKHTNRPELVERYGYDTKYAMHMLRLGLQGIELMTTGRITLPMPEPVRSQLVAVRTGQWSLEMNLAWQAQLEADLAKAIDRADLPYAPDAAKVGRLTADLYDSWWFSHPYV